MDFIKEQMRLNPKICSDPIFKALLEADKKGAIDEFIDALYIKRRELTDFTGLCSLVAEKSSEESAQEKLFNAFYNNQISNFQANIGFIKRKTLLNIGSLLSISACLAFWIYAGYDRIKSYYDKKKNTEKPNNKRRARKNVISKPIVENIIRPILIGCGFLGLGGLLLYKRSQLNRYCRFDTLIGFDFFDKYKCS